MSAFPYTLIDLTHSLSSTTPTWDGTCGFEHTISFDYEPAAEYKFRVHKIGMNEGIGTHMDAPAHCFQGGKTIDQLRLEDLVAPCAVIDVSAGAHERYKVSAQEIENYERAHGKIARGSFVMMKTGWERLWQHPERYHNNHLFPSVSAEAAELLLERGIAGIAIDTLSPDRGEEGFPVHKLLLGADKIIVENACNLDQLSPQGDWLMVVPMKIGAGTEAPVRLIGLKAG